MLISLVLAVATPLFTPPQLFAFNFAAPPRIPLVGDADGDGFADLLCVYPPGGGIVDFSKNYQNQKPEFGVQARTDFGRECLAAMTGDFLGTMGSDVAGVFEDGSVRVAHTLINGRYREVAEVHRFELPIRDPIIGLTSKGFAVVSGSTGKGIRFWFDDDISKTDFQLTADLNWFDCSEDRWFVQMEDGELRAYDKRMLTYKVWRKGKANEPVVRWQDKLIAGGYLIDGRSETPIQELLNEFEPYQLKAADMDSDGIEDLVKFKYGSQKHSAWDIEVLYAVKPDDLDWDRDGLSNAEELKLGTDPWNRDTDNDGLLDGWEVNGYRGLELKQIGCSPLQADVICYIQRNEDVDVERTVKELERVQRFYRELPVENLNMTTGIFLHLIFLDPLPLANAAGKGWPQVGAETMPLEHRGLAHWMHITKGGGGQANQLGDMGAVGDASMYAVFIHEFGHQLGLDHTGHWGPAHCPTYTSLMNYAYSYSFNDKGSEIHYSQGALASYVIRETNLDEVLPFRYEMVSFLERGPYRYRLKASGDTTLIDWNWNGIFGERNIRADINYGYSTTAGNRQTLGKGHSSPWLFVHRQRAVMLFAQLASEPKPGENPNVGVGNQGSLVALFHVEGTSWEERRVIWKDSVIGDPCGMSVGESYFLFAPTESGVKWQEFFGAEPGNEGILPNSKGRNVTCGVALGLPIVVLHGEDGDLRFSVFRHGIGWSEQRELPFRSNTPVGFCEDSKKAQVVFATTEDQSQEKTGRWLLRWCSFNGTDFAESSREWVEGEEGNARGSGRLIPLFDGSEEAGPDGRVYVFGAGLRTNTSAPWSQQYVAHQIADKSIRGGWLVKRYYDEWTNSRSDSAACWYNRDVLWSYRWVDGAQGATDNNVQVGYRGLGIEDDPMGDHDDIGFIIKFGLRRSIMWLGDVRR
jgi:hypothetical protein